MFPVSYMDLGILLAIFMLISAVALVPIIFFCRTLQKCLNRCAPQCRKIHPDQVWLLLIPLFNLGWQFIVVSRMASSLANEFQLRGMVNDPEPGKSLGMIFCIFNLCALIPVLAIFFGMAGMICWVLYWMKIANYSAEIAVSANGSINAG